LSASHRIIAMDIDLSAAYFAVLGLLSELGLLLVLVWALGLT
jgi:hypothetical protein